jgi:hypothetical protein
MALIYLMTLGYYLLDTSMNARAASTTKRLNIQTDSRSRLWATAYRSHFARRTFERASCIM